MNQSIGSVWPLAFTLAFIAFISGFLAFTVNYNKAYKMKDRIVYILEKNDNKLPSSSGSDEISAEIKAYADKIGYNASEAYTQTCNDMGNNVYALNGVCYQEVKVSSDNTNGINKEYTTKYVNIRTFVSIDVPIFNRIFSNIPVFSVKGSTKQVTSLNR